MFSNGSFKQPALSNWMEKKRTSYRRIQNQIKIKTGRYWHKIGHKTSVEFVTLHLVLIVYTSAWSILSNAAVELRKHLLHLICTSRIFFSNATTSILHSFKLTRLEAVFLRGDSDERNSSGERSLSLVSLAFHMDVKFCRSTNSLEPSLHFYHTEMSTLSYSSWLKNSIKQSFHLSWLDDNPILHLLIVE